MQIALISILYFIYNATRTRIACNTLHNCFLFGTICISNETNEQQQQQQQQQIQRTINDEFEERKKIIMMKQYNKSRRCFVYDGE